MNLTVHVKPGSRKGPLVTVDDPEDAPDTATKLPTDAALTVYLQQRAAEGAANEALVKLLAKHFGVSRSAVTIIRGHSSRIKHVRVEHDS
ncbi:DUF167 domain-containing protein [Cryobacterium sp. TMT1-21]|uniref:UPF0235 protein E3O49_04270 n=1 Tax=Cryobacterium shii TaxID=1259235 RepID=A0AAQ2C814_9MICO|nr:DUF167 domain-containing protein [Cryobacterium shii]TFC85263.1 DUF167 domain-containing protein [Cryobacterium sp. TmT2-59]TFD13126.1 DUF167 domain-containing protein [Cryobacterium sp. TMT1-21]TFD20581.1 DUF167 domain-containing protein [Cryobacterium sp. TMT4-10]TFD26241.1 DUF167 domain-containing protein [Cryobacterium sp. TMT2-23]TFD39084.1 DUF167 domain-containing protein [Cryobacterium sp. TMT2-10]